MQKKANGFKPSMAVPLMRRLRLRTLIKTLLVMKLTIFLLTAALCNVHASGVSQSMSFSGKDQPLLKIFSAVKRQTGFSVFYNKGLLAKSKHVSISAHNMPLTEFLEAVLKDQSLNFLIEDKTIVLSEKSPVAASVKSMFSEQAALAVPPKVSGVIRNEKGELLSGVSIRLKGASIGTASSANGTFALGNLTENAVLIISMIGYDPIEVGIRKTADGYTAYTMNKAQSEALKVTAGENVHLEIRLEISSSNLNEVVINTGYQTVKREKMTGAVEVITAKDIANKGFTNVEEALKGTMAGVAVMNVSGRPGAAAQIRIRGINSLTGDVNPIWIIDGMPMQGDLPNIGLAGADLQNSVLTSGIGNIPPDDIESITVLKDAAATAIYGSRAANGVIVVKTKRGRAGKSTVNYQASYSIDEAPKSKLKMMTGEEKVRFETGLYTDFPHLTNDGRVFKLLGDMDKGKITKAEGNAEIERLKGITTDWYDEIFRNAQSTNHVLSLSGGTEKTQYYASLNYLAQEGVMPNNKFSRMGSSLKLTHDLNAKIRVFFDLYTNLRTEQSSASSVNPLQYATYANPYERLYNADKSYAYDRSYFPQLSAIKDDYRYDFNILEDLNNNTFNNKNVSNQINLKLEYKIINSLLFSTQGSFANTSTHGRKVLSPGSYSSKQSAWLNSVYYQEGEITDNLNNGSMLENTGRSQSYTWRNQFEFAKNVKEKHFVSAIVGQEMSDDKSYSFRYYAPEFDPNYGIIGFPDLAGMDPGRFNMGSLSATSEQQRRSLSFFANGSYSYLDKYVVSASYRMDGADIIGTNNRFTPLWNTSFKYNLHREDFLDNFPFINTLAVRGSYGFTGSIDRNAYPFTRMTFGSTSFRYNGEKIPSSISPGNPSIKWQRKQDRSVGLDFSLSNYRVNGTVNYYNNVTGDLLDRKRVAISTGREQVTANVASLVNSGWELSLNTVNVQKKKFRWSTSFNVSFNKNTITETYNKKISSLASVSYGNSSQRLFVQGQPVNAWYGYQFAGVDPVSGNTLAFIDSKDAAGKPIGHPFGDGRYVLNMDTEFSNAALSYLGESYPPVTGGFGTLFSYGRLSLSAQFTFMTGHSINSFISNMGSPFAAGRYNQLASELARWRQVGDITNVPAYTLNANAKTSYFFSNQIEDGSFLKLNNISAGYNLPQNLCSLLKLNSARLNFNIQNLVTFTRYRGIDPETMGAFGYPSAKKFNMNLNIGF